MFTGIVEEIGQIESIERRDRFHRLKIKAVKVLEDLKIGDSVCTNGVCLTAVSVHADSFEAEVMAQTLRHSTLGSLKRGDAVNLERALTLSTRLGGHMVSGHIDGTGKLMRIERETEALWLTIQVQSEFMPYVIDKGSVTLDGVSLTVAARGSDWLKVSLIPHTASATILGGKRVGDWINVELDLIGKYVAQLLPRVNKGGSTCLNSAVLEAFLRD